MVAALAGVRAAIIDLDGTMLDTLPDFHVALNGMRQALDHPGQGVCAPAGAVRRPEAEQERLPHRTRCACLRCLQAATVAQQPVYGRRPPTPW